MGVVLACAVVVLSYFGVIAILKRVNEWYYVNSLGKKKSLLPPGDMGWPLAGNTLSFLKSFRSTDPDSVYHNLFLRYGRTGLYRSHLFGKPTIIITTPELGRRVLTDSGRFEAGYPKATHKLTGERGFNSMSDAEHNRMRRLIAAPLSGNVALSLYATYIEEAVTKALEEWASLGRPIEFATELKKLFFRVMAQIFLGSRADSVLGPVEELYNDVHSGLFALPINFPGFAYHKAMQARKELVKILREVLGERKASKINDPNKCLMDLLIEAEDEEGRKLDDEHIVDLILTFLIAGHDTSYVLGIWNTINLHQHPEVLQEAKKEQEEIMRNRPSDQKGLSLKEIKEMHYLRKVFYETMRLYQYGFVVQRVAKVDVNLNGYLFPKGWRVFISIRAVNIDPHIYANPKDFDPSRWDDNQVESSVAFLGFGGGPKICAGADLAKLLNLIFLHCFLLKYNFERLNPTCECHYIPTEVPKDNCLAKIEKLK